MSVRTFNTQVRQWTLFISKTKLSVGSWRCISPVRKRTSIYEQLDSRRHRGGKTWSSCQTLGIPSFRRPRWTVFASSYFTCVVQVFALLLCSGFWRVITKLDFSYSFREGVSRGTLDHYVYFFLVYFRITVFIRKRRETGYVTRGSRSF